MAIAKRSVQWARAIDSEANGIPPKHPRSVGRSLWWAFAAQQVGTTKAEEAILGGGGSSSHEADAGPPTGLPSEPAPPKLPDLKPEPPTEH